ncbi:hypothetical protein MSG28_012927 [Choristoneura fumiferana]|uniref:Uncharacterized protein n=1 Tax=Choristoneura fumiferana TaxID=7141 RepID=A0ACC0KRC9_CHOFU|nr:hypothetical protein MSG28_012927 [Choristoneura fumiferana]
MLARQRRYRFPSPRIARSVSLLPRSRRHVEGVPEKLIDEQLSHAVHRVRCSPGNVAIASPRPASLAQYRFCLARGAMSKVYREKLIDEVKKYPVLYDTRHENHRDIDGITTKAGTPCKKWRLQNRMAFVLPYMTMRRTQRRTKELKIDVNDKEIQSDQELEPWEASGDNDSLELFFASVCQSAKRLPKTYQDQLKRQFGTIQELGILNKTRPDSFKNNVIHEKQSIHAVSCAWRAARDTSLAPRQLSALCERTVVATSRCPRDVTRARARELATSLWPTTPPTPMQPAHATPDPLGPREARPYRHPRLRNIPKCVLWKRLPGCRIQLAEIKVWVTDAPLRALHQWLQNQPLIFVICATQLRQGDGGEVFRRRLRFCAPVARYSGPRDRSVFVFIFRALVQVFAPEELVHEDEHVSVLVAMRVRRAAGGAPHQRLAVVVADVVPSGLARRRCKKDNPVVISVELVSHLPPDFKLGAAVGVPRVRRVVEQAARAHGRDQPRVGVRLQMPEGAQ